MDGSSILTLFLIVVPVSAGLVVFGLLRQRGAHGGVAGCAAAATCVGLVSVSVSIQILQVSM